MRIQGKNGSVASGAATPAIPARDEVEPSTADIRRRRIAIARKALAERYAADPEGVDRFNARMANLTTAKKRERERFEHVVLGKDRGPPPMPTLVRPVGMSGVDWKVERKRRLVDHRAAVKEYEAARRTKALVSTVAFSRAHADAIIQLERNGTITAEQAEWVAQISNVHRSIEADVAVNVASMEARSISSAKACTECGCTGPTRCGGTGCRRQSRWCST